MKITAKRTNGPSIDVEYDFGNNLDELVQKFGPDIVFNHAKGSLVVSLQGWLRGKLDDEKAKPADIRTAAANWKPGTRKQGKSQAEKLKDQLSKMTPEDRAALLKELRASTGPKAVAGAQA